MENIKKIIIITLIAVIIALSGAIALVMTHENTKTVEIFKNGTTIEVPASAKITEQDEFTATYRTSKNTTVFGHDTSNLTGTLASGILSKIITSKGEKQDNGLYKFNKKSLMEINNQFDMEFDEKDITEFYIGFKHNDTVNQTVFISGFDENEMINILESITWKQGHTVKTAQIASAEPASSQATSDDKTFPFYADDGSIVGYYHVGDVVEHYDGLYQLKADGSWVYIGEAQGSSQNAYEQGYSDAVDDVNSYSDYSYDDYDYDYDYDYDDYDYDDYEN